MVCGLRWPKSDPDIGTPGGCQKRQYTGKSAYFIVMCTCPVQGGELLLEGQAWNDISRAKALQGLFGHLTYLTRKIRWHLSSHSLSIRPILPASFEFLAHGGVIKTPFQRALVLHETDSVVIDKNICANIDFSFSPLSGFRSNIF